MHRLDVKRIQVADALRWCGGCGGQGRLRVRDVMTPSPTCIASSTSALDVVRMFHAKEFRHLLVTDARGRLLGLVSDRDVLLSGISAAEIMSSDLISVRPDMPLVEALTDMLGHGISCLPVLADDKLVGILTSTDMNTVLEVLLQTAQAAVADHADGQSPAERMAVLVAERRSR